jgi:hypothetical protein
VRLHGLLSLPVLETQHQQNDEGEERQDGAELFH